LIAGTVSQNLEATNAMDATPDLTTLSDTRSPRRASSRVRGMQITALTLLVISGVVNYIDRATLAIGNPLIRADLHLSVADMGLLLSAFLWAYAFAQLPVGGLVDRFGPRRLLGFGILLWSAAQGLTGLAGSFGQFVFGRAALGLGEAPQFPTAARVVRDWFNVRGRGTATGVFNCSSTLGTAIGAPLLTAVMLAVGWRWMFGIMGIAGVVVAVLWMLLYRDATACNLTAEEDAYRKEGDETGEARRVTFGEWRRLFGCATTWGMIIGFFGVVYLTWVYTAWLPGYLEMQRHMTIRNAGFATAAPFVAGVIGGLFGGWLTDWLMARGLSPINSRRVPMTISLLGMAACTIAAAVIPSNALAVAFISAAMFLGYVASSAAWAMASVAAPANTTASLGAMQNFGGYLGGALAPMVTGFIVQATGSFVPALMTAAGIGVVCAIGYFAIIRHPITAADLGS
jgi:MFS family permease